MRLALLSMALVLGGCVTTRSVVRDRFAKEHGCPEEKVTVDEPAGARYGVRGCDEEATYVCTNTLIAFKGGAQCIEQGLPNPPDYRARESQALPPPDPRIPP